MDWRVLVLVGMLGCDSGTQVSPGSDLRAADLAGIDYAGADLAGVDYAGVDYSGVDYAGVDYSGVDFSGIDFSSKPNDLAGVDLAGVAACGPAEPGVCSAFSCMCCPGPGASEHCLCTTTCQKASDCTDPARPRCDIAPRATSGLCMPPTVSCCWLCQ